MSDDFYRKLDLSSSITKVNDVDREVAIRLYCTQSGAVWALQVRGPMKLANYQEGKDFIVASASLRLEDLKALRDAVNAEIKRAEDES